VIWAFSDDHTKYSCSLYIVNHGDASKIQNLMVTIFPNIHGNQLILHTIVTRGNA
jgi:hypothetical protein